jgi:group I intron endonuclease
MRIFKSHPLLKLVNSYIIDSPQPSNLSYLWNFGSLLAVCLVIQIITGVTLAMHYNPSVLEAFNSIEHIMRDVNNGWLIRYLHSNTASAFFFLVYLHIGRGLYYGSYRSPRTLVWTLGTIIFILMVVTAFLGLLHSPKWFKFKNKNNNNNDNNNKNKKNLNANNNNNLNFENNKRRFNKNIKKYLEKCIAIIILIFLTIFSITLNMEITNTPEYIILSEHVEEIFLKEKSEPSIDLDWTSWIESDDTNTYYDIEFEESEISTPYDIWDSEEPIGLERLFHEPESNINFFEFDMMYHEITNAERFINNGFINVIINDANAIITQETIELISNNPNMEMHPSPTESVRDLNEWIRNIVIDKNDNEVTTEQILGERVRINENIQGYAQETQVAINAALETNMPVVSSNEGKELSNSSNYSKLVRGIREGKDISIYSLEENGAIFKEWSSSTSSSKGDWTNLRPLIDSPIIEKSTDAPNIPTRRQFIVMKDSSVNITDEIVMKHWFSKYPFFPEHYEQIAASSQEATNEAIWLAQQDNSLQWDAPTTEGEESFYLEELFGEKKYPKENTFSNSSVKGLGYSPFSPGGSRRGFSTSSIKLKISNKSPSGNEENVEKSKEVTQFLKEKNLSSVFVYENLQENFTKTKIRKDTLNLSGIYLILNKFTLDYYIGSASTNKFYSRFSNHLFNFNGSKVVKAAVKKYKITSFAFIILELFPEIVTKDNNKQLLDIEDFYLKSLLPNYNILTEAGNNFGYKHSEITRIRMKDNYSIERRLRIGNFNKGRIYTDEEREKLRIVAFNRKKAVYTEEGIMNMKKNSKPITIYNFDDTVYGEFSSIIEAAKALKCDKKTIARALNTPKQILRRRWIVKYSSK